MDQDTPVSYARIDEMNPSETATQFTAQLYDLNAIAYESLLLGVFAIFHGQGK